MIGGLLGKKAEAELYVFILWGYGRTMPFFFCACASSNFF